MATAKIQRNGRIDRLEDALTNLLLTQTGLAARQAKTDRRFAECERLAADRFQRIESSLLDLSRVLHEQGRVLQDHGQLLAALPDAVREKMGFRQS